MNAVAISFASLVKNNNGMFKSEAQAKFLLSQCQEEWTFVCGGPVYKNSYTLFYTCNELGVVKVEKYLPKTGRNVITWERQTEEQYNATLVNKALSKKLNAEREADSQAKWKARQDAFDCSLVAAQAFIRRSLEDKGRESSLIDRIISSTMKDHDDITRNLDGLLVCQEFAAAWEAFQGMEV